MREIEAIPQKRVRQRVISRIRALAEDRDRRDVKNSPGRIVIVSDKALTGSYIQSKMMHWLSTS